MNSKFFSKKFFSTRNFLFKEFKLSKKEIRALNNEIKSPWVKPGWDRIVN
jgi:hypothetical protein